MRLCATLISYFNAPAKDLLNTSWSMTELSESMELVVLDHTFSRNLMQAAAHRVRPLQKIYDTMAHVGHEQATGFGRGGHAWYHELRKPTALYNWELGLHSVLLAVDRFFAVQQFDEALEVARLVFDPTLEIEVERLEPDELGKDKPVKFKTCWRFPPFQEIARKISLDGEKPLDMKKLGKDLDLAIQERRSHGLLVHATGRSRPQAYMKWIVMKYAEILIASGDIHFRKGTLESLPFATQKYIEATHTLGPEPVKVPKLGNRKGKALCFDDLDEKAVEYKLSLPFSAELRKAGKEELELDPKKENMYAFVQTPYFCVPINPQFRRLRSLVFQRLYNLRNSRDIDGKPVVYALRDPPIDPGALVASAGSLGGAEALSVVMGDREGPLPKHRFDVLIRSALELCGELHSLGERFISAVEKKESEWYNIGRTRHTSTIQSMMLDIKKTQHLEAQGTIDSLAINREAQISQLRFYLALIGEPDSKIPATVADPWDDIKQDIDIPSKDDLRLSSYEKREMDSATAAAVLNGIAAGLDLIVAPLCMIPQISTMAAPLGVGASISIGGNNMTNMMQAGSQALKMGGFIASEIGAAAGRKAQLTRQLQDRRLQANMRGREIKSIDKQIEVQRIRIKAAEKEIEMQQAEIDDTKQMEAWYRTKYTNEQLYSWMEKSLRGLYFQAYTLAMTMARRAEGAFSFEQGRKVSMLRQGGYWDASRDGLFAADNLYLDLKRLENAYFDAPDPDFEVTKTVSLRSIDPVALLKLRLTGSADFQVPEVQFDMDFPGHYMRKIRSVAVSIPAVLGAHSGVNATLTLLEHKYRVNATATNGADYISGFTDNESFKTDHIPITAIAISSGVNDAGVFELNFAGPRYMPFEGAGVVSTWRLELPTEIRKFDYNTISDVLLHIQYTALDGGICLRNAANESVRKAVRKAEEGAKTNGIISMWDLKNEFGSEWHRFTSRLLKAKKTETEVISMSLGDVKGRLPYWVASQAGLEVQSISFVSKAQDMIAGLSLGFLPGSSTWITTPIGNSTMRTLEGLRITELDGWSVTAPLNLLNEGKAAENVYMLVRYVVTSQTKRT